MKKLVKRSPIQVQEADWGERWVDRSGRQVGQPVRPDGLETATALHQVAICDQSQRGKLRIEGQEAGDMLSAADLAINGGRKMDNGHLYRLRGDLYFLSVNTEDEQVAEKKLLNLRQKAGSFVTITNVTHGSGEIWLIGPKSSEVLGRLCGLDFHNSHFPNLTAKQSSLAKTKQLIIRRDIDGNPAYALIGGRSLANYLWHTIISAGKDLGIQQIGWQSVEMIEKK